MKLLWREQKGAVSIFALCCMMVLVTFSAGIYLFSRVEYQTQQRFLLGWEVKRAAQDGIAGAQQILNEQTSTGEEILQGKGKIFALQSYATDDNELTTTVQAKEKSGEILVLAIARKQGLSRRAVAYFKKIGSGGYEISHLEN